MDREKINTELHEYNSKAFKPRYLMSGLLPKLNDMKILYSIILLFLTISGLNAQTDSTKSLKPFIAYEFGEAVFNKFQSISGEAGLMFKNQHSIRMVHMNVNLTEEHLSSDFAGAIEGDSIEGKFLGFELFYDFPVLIKGLQISPSLGFYRNEYTHTGNAGSFSNNSMTVGAALSYYEKDIFKVSGLYYRVSIPVRTPFNPISETMLGNATIKDNRFDNNIWLFLGYQF